MQSPIHPVSTSLRVLLVACLVVVLTLLSTHAFDTPSEAIPSPPTVTSALILDTTQSAATHHSDETPLLTDDVLLCAALGLICALGAIALTRLTRLLGSPQSDRGMQQRSRTLTLTGTVPVTPSSRITFTLNQLGISRV